MLLIVWVVLLALIVYLIARVLGRGRDTAQRAIRAAEDLQERAERDRYLRGTTLAAWRREYPDPASLLLSPWMALLMRRMPLGLAYLEAEEVLSDVDGWVADRNADYVAAELERIERWAEDRFEFPLTSAQRRALVVDDDCNLIVAGAGTGKTTTLVAKAAYLVEHCDIPQSEILILAFNVNVASEIRERLRANRMKDVEVGNFHAKGYEILGRATGRKPAVSKLAEDDHTRRRLFKERFFTWLTADKDFYEGFSRWWVDFRVTREDFEDCETPDERLRRERALDLRALDGTQLRSQAEVKVADWLTLNGVSWEHEARYPHAPSSSRRRDYIPDFYLPDADIWLEVWACRADQTDFPPEIDADQYRRDMAWKRRVHEENQSALIELHQDEIWGGRLGAVLEERLGPTGVRLRALDQQELERVLGERDSEAPRFVRIVESFLELFRAGAWTRDKVTARAESDRDREFLNLFWPFLDAYEDALEEEGKIDFHEMLIGATRHLEEGVGDRTYQYILVDEFQDTSKARLDLIQALRGFGGRPRLFLVGDDWQAIYRFTGADVSFFTDAESHRGTTARVDLDRSFRLLSDVEEVSTRFVTKNPAQLEKEIRPAQESTGESGVSIRFHPADGEKAALEATLMDIAHREPTPATVLVLGRYNFQLSEVDQHSLGDLGTGAQIQAETVHRAKGLESDHVIIIGLESGVFGFPSEIVDDRVLRLVMSEPDSFPNAEERRLFYVALTRTAGRAYLLANSSRPSSFVQELLEDEFRAWVETIGEESKRYRCPRCRGRTIKRWDGRYGAFWGCINFPACRGRLSICPGCESGVLEPSISQDRKVSQFQCVECSGTVRTCPRCGAGAMVPKKGEHGPFIGCSNWRKDGSGCPYTEDSA